MSGPAERLPFPAASIPRGLGPPLPGTATRSPAGGSRAAGTNRTAPLAGLWTHQKGGFYHDGRFATLKDVLAHYDRHFKLGLSDQEKAELIEYLKSL